MGSADAHPLCAGDGARRKNGPHATSPEGVKEQNIDRLAENLIGDFCEVLVKIPAGAKTESEK
jgi:hypothetical protein